MGDSNIGKIVPKVTELTFRNSIPVGEALSMDPDDEATTASDNDSNASAASDESEMEPFQDYLPKIEQLLHDIGLADYLVEPIQHGYSFINCVYALKSPKVNDEQYILRVPNCPEDFREGEDERCESTVNDAAMLSYLADKFPVPRVKAYNSTVSNPLCKPFMVQTRLPGESLNNVYEDLRHDDKLAIVDQYVALLAQLESLTFPNAGTFAASMTQPNSINDFFAADPPYIKVFDDGDEDFVVEPKCLQNRIGPDIKAFLVSHIDGWIAKENKDQSGHFSILDPYFRRLLTMIDELDAERAFADGPYPVILHHWDLEPRNIMVEKINDQWRFHGVIDWDDTITLPRPLARRPPEWIWAFDSEMCTGYLDNDVHPSRNELSDEDTALKTYFEATATRSLPDYLEDAYGRGRWLRRIWLFVRSEIHQPHMIDAMEQLLKGWEARPRPTVSKSNEPKVAELQASDIEAVASQPKETRV